jgi:hypothetical protein
MYGRFSANLSSDIWLVLCKSTKISPDSELYLSPSNKLTYNFTGMTCIITRHFTHVDGAHSIILWIWVSYMTIASIQKSCLFSLHSVSELPSNKHLDSARLVLCKRPNLQSSLTDFYLLFHDIIRLAVRQNISFTKDQEEMSAYDVFLS